MDLVFEEFEEMRQSIGPEEAAVVNTPIYSEVSNSSSTSSVHSTFTVAATAVVCKKLIKI